ncbi:MAG TPA: amidase [Acidimicrobiales bacterium]|nr:amidase [Acidimicrobiales bacterium]
MSDRPLTVAEAAASLRRGEVSSVELTTTCIDRANEIDGELGCFLSRFDSTALAAARAADHDFAEGIDRGPLQGIPVAVKDLIASQEGPTTAHSLVPDPPAPAGVDATTVSRLRQGGAVLMGKTSLSEFAFGTPDPDSGLPIPRNPWAVERWPGGSSSGTASGVAAGLFLAGLGSDTGGSIRIPAALCGITGLKPTLGLVPTAGCIPLAWSLDTIGPMARTAEDCEAMLDVLRGKVQSAGQVVDTEPDQGLTGLRIGVERVHHDGRVGVGDEVVHAFEQALAILAEAGAHVDEVVLDHYDEALAATLIITHVEALAHHRANLRDRWGDYGAVTRNLLSHGAFYSGSDYVAAQQVRAVVRHEVDRLFDCRDVIITPTVGAVAPRLDEDLLAFMPLLFTGIWNIAGNPALSIPAGVVESLPVGMQVVGRPYDEHTVLRVGRVFQQRSDWHRRMPELSTSRRPVT